MNIFPSLFHVQLNLQRTGALGEPPSTLPTVSKKKFNFCPWLAGFLKFYSFIYWFILKNSTGRNQPDRPDTEEEEGNSKRAGWLHGTYMAELLWRMLLCDCKFACNLLRIMIFKNTLVPEISLSLFVHIVTVRGGFSQHCSGVFVLYPAAVCALGRATARCLCAYSVQQEVKLVCYHCKSLVGPFKQNANIKKKTLQAF